MATQSTFPAYVFTKTSHSQHVLYAVCMNHA